MENKVKICLIPTHYNVISLFKYFLPGIYQLFYITLKKFSSQFKFSFIQEYVFKIKNNILN